MKDNYNKVFKAGNNDFDNIYNNIKIMRDISTTFMNSNTTAAWFEWLNRCSTTTLEEASNTLLDSNTEVTRVTKLTRTLYNEQLAPINNMIEKLESVDEEICSVMMYSV